MTTNEAFFKMRNRPWKNGPKR